MKIDLAFRRGDFQFSAQTQLDGGVTGICGASGSGKSTFLALLAGLLRPSKGTLSFANVDLIDTQRGIFVPAWKRHFGLVYQNGMLFPHLSVRDNLLYGFNRLDASERHFDLKTVTTLLEIESLLERRPDQLSGGERQRVALGRALLYSPRLLLMDEPLSSLDDRLKQQILPFLKRVKTETRIPMIYVTHAQAEVDYLADRVLTMEEGRLGE